MSETEHYMRALSELRAEIRNAATIHDRKARHPAATDEERAYHSGARDALRALLTDDN